MAQGEFDSTKTGGRDRRCVRAASTALCRDFGCLLLEEELASWGVRYSLPESLTREQHKPLGLDGVLGSGNEER